LKTKNRPAVIFHRERTQDTTGEIMPGYKKKYGEKISIE
jgi:hypothetical protein